MVKESGELLPVREKNGLMKRFVIPKSSFVLGLTTRLHEENIGQDTILEIERRFNERGAKYGENGNVTGAVARRILETAL